MLILVSIGFAQDTDRSDRPSIATDLYHVEVGSHEEAGLLSGFGANAILRVGDGYLILAGPVHADQLARSGLKYTLITSDVDRRHLALDIRHDRSNVGRFPLVFEEEGLRLFLVKPSEAMDARDDLGLAPIPAADLRIVYKDQDELGKRLRAPDLGIELDSLVELISQDSIESYSYWLQNYRGRPAGSNQGVAGDLEDKFREFGYDSVYLDEFWRLDWYGTHLYHGWNVVARKAGTLYPHDQIIVGAHFDTEAVSPGADDNGSGTAGVLEIARVLSDIETNMEIVFILFDCEEEGLLGAYDYAEKAVENNDRIVFMLNLDMIGFYRNSAHAKLYHGPSTAYASIWAALSDSLPSVGIEGHLSGASGGSDHAPFSQLGYDVVFAHEAIFSNVYHSARDSTTYLDFDYMTRMTMASLATAYYVDGSYVPDPTLLISCPEGPTTFFLPGSADSLTVNIEEYAGGVLSPGTAQLVCIIDGGSPITFPLADCGDGIYTVPFPSLECGERLDYYVMASEDVTSTVCFYPDPLNPTQALKASNVTAILDDNFETDLGWSVTGNATSGDWERYKASGNGSVPKFDYDGSGRCYITDHSIFSDVDNGTTALISPAIDIFPGDAIVEYARWFSNDLGASGYEDIFKVYLLHGEQINLVEVVGPTGESSGDWYYRKHWVSDFFTPESTVRLRFDACDLNYDSEVEAAVDAVKITVYSYAPHILTDLLPDEIFGNPYNQQLDVTSCHDPVTWMDINSDLDGTGLSLSTDGLLSGVPSDTGIVSFTARAEDGNGVPSERTYSFHIWKPFVCGDAGMDYQLNIGDGVFLINYIFKGGPAPFPLCVGDSNGDDNVDVGDAVYLINHIFKGGSAPVDDCCQL